MANYYIAPESSFDATADAIRAKTGSQAAIEWTEDGFADAIEDIPTGSSENKWRRPSGWPDYDSLNLGTTKEESIYFTYDNRSKGGWVGIYCAGDFTVQRVTISNGTVTVVSSQNVNAGNFQETIPSNAGDWVCYRIIPQSGNHITEIGMANSSTNIRFTVQACVERYGYLPNITQMNRNWNDRGWGIFCVVSDTLLGLPANTSIRYYGSYATARSIENIKTDSTIIVDASFRFFGPLRFVDWTKIKLPSSTTSLNLWFDQSMVVGDVDLSGTTLGTITNIGGMGANRTITSLKFPDADYSEITSLGGYFNNCSALKVIDLPASMVGSIGTNFMGGCAALVALVLRANAVVPLAATGNIIADFLNKGGNRVFVPSAKLNDYKTATNWSDLYASYPDMFAAIEGSAYA